MPRTHVRRSDNYDASKLVFSIIFWAWSTSFSMELHRLCAVSLCRSCNLQASQSKCGHHILQLFVNRVFRNSTNFNLRRRVSKSTLIDISSFTQTRGLRDLSRQRSQFHFVVHAATRV